MSDFLSNFSGDNKNKKPIIPPESKTKNVINNSDALKNIKPAKDNKIGAIDENLEIDTRYKRKKTLKILITIISILVISIVSYLIYYSVVHIPVPNFIGEEFSKATTWAKKNNIELNVEKSFSNMEKANIVLDQGVAPEKKIKKGEAMSITISQGTDPDEVIGLPDFESLTFETAQQWKEEHNATNLTILNEFNNDIEKTKYIRLSITDENLAPANFKRKDYAKVYYSKGKEDNKKDIEVPDFAEKTKAEVNTWAKSKDIKVEFSEEESEKIAVGSVISQSISAKEKISKDDSLSVVLSIGKLITVPNFSSIPKEEALTTKDLAVTIREKFSNLSYGTLMSQSLAAGTKLKPEDDKNIILTYSEGLPYLKDLRGAMLGDIQKILHDNYISKGIHLTYNIIEVNSYETKGKVVDISHYNDYIPMTFHLEISVSKENLSKPDNAQLIPAPDLNPVGPDDGHQPGPSGGQPGGGQQPGGQPTLNGMKSHDAMKLYDSLSSSNDAYESNDN